MERIPPSPVISIRETPASTPPVNPPRQVGPGVFRSILLEPRVRRWWLMGIVVFLIFAAFSGDRLWARHVEILLIRTGIIVHAKVTWAENKVGDMPFTPSEMCRLEMTLPDKTQEDVTGHLTRNSAIGQDVVLRVDPADHTRWTDRDAPTPILDTLLIGMIGLPVIPLFILVGFFESRALQNTWKNGPVAVAVIFDRKHSPIAPMSYSLRCTMQGKKQLFTVCVPQAAYGLERGDLIWVITPPTNKGRPLAAMWMPGGGTDVAGLAAPGGSV